MNDKIFYNSSFKIHSKEPTCDNLVLFELNNTFDSLKRALSKGLRSILTPFFGSFSVTTVLTHVLYSRK